MRSAIASALAAALAVSLPAPARADEDAAATLRQEWVGLELTPLSLNSGTDPSGQAPDRFRPGLGGTLRLLRHRWLRIYWTPLAAGLFVVSENDIIYTHIETEAGYILPLGPRALELGMAAGAGILAMKYTNSGCDGSCNLGGAGPMLSPVARLVLRGGPRLALAVSFRAVIPLHVPSGEWFGYTTGRGLLYLGGLDVAVGR